ncbi:hypothetical protein MJA45_21400 [Paenibacillus aurantius]|uniref:Uncharacterized protein n=1 Tax=Paenibacillus aurantius TaxID=2918900 RepID=A0AA96LBG2_9BACL|nr:hypothetical protein [Paenibacillus aurantius]WNQ10155.1 hypothetical protein MJA45_21400 [Paenibacillus aurantius]
MDHRELAGGMDERQPENGKREESDLMQLVEIMNNPQHEADWGLPGTETGADAEETGREDKHSF